MFDRRKYMKEYMKNVRKEKPQLWKKWMWDEHLRKQKRRHDLKKELVQLFGGACKKCRYNTYMGALEFAHVDGNNKEKSLGYWVTVLQKKKALEEANRCVLLCNRCHKEYDAGLWSIAELG